MRMPQKDSFDLCLEAKYLICRILTTTACNGHCSYCYENGTAILWMNDETAEGTARFLVERAREEQSDLQLEWFGGEPTLNLGAADRITSILWEARVPFISSVVTNGLLADQCLQAQRHRLLNLHMVQITLDGTERFHESVKGFPPGSFERVLRNVEVLAEEGIAVKLRLNYADNGEELHDLVDVLVDRFSGSRLIYSYVSPVCSGEREFSRQTMRDVLDLSDRLIRHGLASEERLYRLRERRERCFMMTPRGFTIAPDGRLYNCSHNMTVRQCVGSVFGYNPDHPARLAFLRTDSDSECIACDAFPICKGGCRIGELGLAQMYQCHPYKSVLDEIRSKSCNG